MGDTAISLHIRAPRNSGGGGSPDQLNPNCQDLSKSAFSGWGAGGCGVLVVVVQTNSTQSAKICPNLLFRGGGEVVVQTTSTQSAKICLNLHFQGGGGWWWSRPTQSKVPRSAFRGGGGVDPDPLNPKCQDLSKSTWGGGGGGCGSRPTQPKVPRSVQICIFGGGGRGWWFRPTFLKYLSGGTQGILNQKFWQLECVVHHR